MTMNKTNRTLICAFNNTGSDVLVWQIGAFLFPVIGLPGHLLMIITIFNSNRRHYHPTCLYFIFIAITESIYLLFVFWDWLDVVNLLPDPRKVLNCAYFYPFVHGTAFISLLLVLQLHIDRIRIINTPQNNHAKITTQHILIKIFLTYTTMIFFFLHYRYSLHYSHQTFIIYGQHCSVYNHAYQWFYSIWPYIHLFSRLIPCLLIILCTLYICRNRQHDNNPSLIHRQQQTLSIVLVYLSIYIFVAVLPITILQFFNYRMSEYEIDYRYPCRCAAKKWKLVNALFIMWEASTYMNKFYIRLIVSSEFRHDVKQTICRYKYKQTNFI